MFFGTGKSERQGDCRVKADTGPEERMNLSLVFNWIDRAFAWAWTTSMHSVALILIALIIVMVGRRLEPRVKFILGLLVLIRLAMPSVPESRFSLDHIWLSTGLMPPTAVIQTEVTTHAGTEVQAAETKARVPDRLGGQLKPTVRILALAWTAGVVGLMIAAIWRDRCYRRWFKRQPVVTDARLCGLLEDCRGQLGVKRRLVIVRSPRLSTPAVFGWRHPALILPKGIEQLLDDQELRMVFLHELVHVKRNDAVLNWIMIGVRAVHWFNPLVWLTADQLRADRELLCDHLVLSGLRPEERHAYGATLIKLVDRISTAGLEPSLAAVASSKQHIKERIIMITQFKKPNRLSLATAAVALIGLCLVTFTQASAEDEATNNSPPRSAPEIRELKPRRPKPALADIGEKDRMRKTEEVEVAADYEKQIRELQLAADQSRKRIAEERQRLAEIKQECGRLMKLSQQQTAAVMAKEAQNADAFDKLAMEDSSSDPTITTKEKMLKADKRTVVRHRTSGVSAPVKHTEEVTSLTTVTNEGKVYSVDAEAHVIKMKPQKRESESAQP
jgi:bla regulator protein blaR1